MKFSLATAFSGLLLATSALAQGIQIGAAPKDMSIIHPGQELLIEVDRHNTLQSSTEVAIVIGLNSCHNTTCVNPADSILGSILYNGPYKPQIHDNAVGKPPHQNFTVTVPSTIEKGNAQLVVFHVTLIGASQSIPFTEFRNLTLVVV
ncbi:hypothetical protein D9619_013214 [Psilocybe cf. subviscida]|uniref:Uncharacterized protein n=1 Tax=Psilocybe cf. subviscida TaxID=2480587 RepID=A0A8H5B7T6_9AGAR|nr:hypothetical protein D9619_013214 [Psilocybe cf. subviscida]